jgi:ABC-type uncharacterized transport system substrate-binding protein
LGALTVFGLAFANPAQAHPHLLITIETTVVYENGAFTGLQHAWTFDEMNSAAEIEGLDKNNDGKYERAELQELADLYAQRLKAASFFTNAKLARQAIQFGSAKDQWVEYKNNVMTLHFTAPFATPVLSDAHGLTFSVGDPSFYIAFSLAEKTDAVRFSSGAPPICKATIAEAAAPQPSGLQESFSAFNAFGLSLPKTVLVECKAS